MKSQIILLLTIASSVLAADVGDNIKQDHARIAKEIDTWPFPKTLFLYSIDPMGFHDYSVNKEKIFRNDSVNTEQVFHGFEILGKAEITTENDKTALLTTFAQGIRQSNGTEASCFNPRHGLRVVVGTSTNDFTICFECLSVRAYGFHQGQEFSITASPSDKFNELVEKYHLKKANRDDH